MNWHKERDLQVIADAESGTSIDTLVEKYYLREHQIRLILESNHIPYSNMKRKKKEIPLPENSKDSLTSSIQRNQDIPCKPQKIMTVPKAHDHTKYRIRRKKKQYECGYKPYGTLEQRMQRNNEIITYARNGETLDEIGQRYNRSSATIYLILKKAGVEIRRHQQDVHSQCNLYSDRNKQILTDALTGNYILDELGEKYNLTAERIRQILQKQGYNILEIKQEKRAEL